LKKNKAKAKAEGQYWRDNRIYRSCFKVTEDDWYPAYRMSNGNTKLVMVSVFHFIQTLDALRVCVWGMDDLGLEKDFTDADEALKLYNDILDLPFVNRDVLYKMGLINA
jgi:hypothetical protein